MLKVDTSFVAALSDGDEHRNAQTRKLLKAILDVGQALSLTVIAEGIEQQSQASALLEMGCELGAGLPHGDAGSGPVDRAPAWRRRAWAHTIGLPVRAE